MERRGVRRGEERLRRENRKGKERRRERVEEMRGEIISSSASFQRLFNLHH